MIARTVVLRLFLLLGVMVAALPAVAQEGVIAVVNLQQIMSEAAAVESVRSQLQDISAQQQTQIEEEENALRALDQELQQQRALVSAEVFAERRQEFQQRAAQLQQRVRSVRQTLDDAFESTMGRIRGAALEEISILAEENGIDLVLAQSQVVVARNIFDLTPIVLQRLNERLPSVTVTATETAQ